MTEEQKQRVAVFRFGIIHDFIGSIRLSHGEQEKFLREKCTRKWEIPCSNQSRISRSTILRWARLYQEGGSNLEVLYPKGRNDSGQTRVLDQETCLALATLRRQLPKLTVSDLVKQMEERRLITVLIPMVFKTAMPCFVGCAPR